MPSPDKLSPTDKALQKVADLIIERMETLKAENWQKPWFDNSSYQGSARNFLGRPYGGMNTFILDLYTSMKGHDVPVFMTFNQAVNSDLHINKGAKAVPVFYMDVIRVDAEGKKVSQKDLDKMTDEQIAALDKRFFVKKYDVFNVADTNLREVKPEVYDALLKEFSVKKLPDAQGMYANPALDRMFAHQEWLCPIEQKGESKAYYRPSADTITLPFKAQFKQGKTEEEIYRNGMAFYATALHEMAHSTGSPERLNREGGKRFGDEKYAKEELVAELTSATVSRQLGFDKHLTDNSAMYLAGWLQALKEEPKFLYTVLTEVGKAQGLIMEAVEKQNQLLEKTLPTVSPEMLAASEAARNAKNNHPDALILLREGQNYRIYHEDATVAANALGLPLQKFQQEGKDVPLQVVSFDREKLETYLPQLVKAGHRIAIEEPRLATAEMVKMAKTMEALDKAPERAWAWRAPGTYMLFGHSAEVAEKVLGLTIKDYQMPGQKETMKVAEIKPEDFSESVKHLIDKHYGMSVMSPQIEARLVTMKDDTHAVRATINGQDTGLIPMDAASFRQYLKLDSDYKQVQFLGDYALDHQAKAKVTATENQNKSLSPKL